MKITINLPYAEYPVNAIKTVVMVPVHVVQHVVEQASEATTEAAVGVVLNSERGQEMLAAKLLAGLQAAAMAKETDA